MRTPQRTGKGTQSGSLHHWRVTRMWRAIPGKPEPRLTRNAASKQGVDALRFDTGVRHDSPNPSREKGIQMNIKIEHHDDWSVKVHNDLEIWEQHFRDNTTVIALWKHSTGTGTVDVLDSTGNPFTGTKKGIADRELWEQVRETVADTARCIDD